MSKRRRVARLSAMASWGVIALGLPLAARAQRSCEVRAPRDGSRWSAPLDRVVTLDARGISLHDALDRLTTATAVSFAYSPDIIAPAQRVCVTADRQPLGDVLGALLARSRASASVVGGQVVITPAPATAPRGSRDSVDLLERVVVRDDATARARPWQPVAMDVIEGATLRRQSATSLADMLDAAAPGAWMWSSSPGSVIARYGGFRGATSFGATAPKIYLDGVEVANPLLVTQLDPDAVDRIEVIRGPQGAALYGSDAIGGVVNVLTRHDGAGTARARLLASATAGASQSAFGQGLVATQEQRLALRMGDELGSFGLSAQFGQGGAVFPSAQTRHAAIVADARLVMPDAIWTFSARYSDRTAGAGDNPLLLAATGSPVTGQLAAGATSSTLERDPQSAREYTLGTTIDFAPSGRWSPSILVGLDSYSLQHVAPGDGLFATASDSALRATEGGGTRSTIRASTVGRFDAHGRLPATTVTLGLDESILALEAPDAALGAYIAAPAVNLLGSAPATWNSNTGAFAQLGASWRDALIITAGLRVERNDAFTGTDRHPLLPMIGVASVRDLGAAQLRLRAAYGRGIRPATSGTRTALDPESQSGTELGAELGVAGVLSLGVTRFDQLASGLVQAVPVGAVTMSRTSGSPEGDRLQLQNVGQIANSGWEMQASATRAELSLRGSLTLVDSRVRTLASGYLGDLRSGDLMLGVPTRTASVSAGWTAADWSGTVAVRQAARWISYDRLALARDQAAGGVAPVGAGLRAYWMEYGDDTDVRVSGTHALRGGLELLVTGDNLLGHQVGAPDNVTIRPGRTITAGLRTGF